MSEVLTTRVGLRAECESLFDFWKPDRRHLLSPAQCCSVWCLHTAPPLSLSGFFRLSRPMSDGFLLCFCCCRFCFFCPCSRRKASRNAGSLWTTGDSCTTKIHWYGVPTHNHPPPTQTHRTGKDCRLRISLLFDGLLWCSEGSRFSFLIIKTTAVLRMVFLIL